MTMCAQQNRIRVMIADDSSEMRQGLTMFIEFEGFELVGIATTGAEAVALCETACPQVVLMDLMMPEMDGLTATRLLRKRYPDIRVIVLTSYRQELTHAALRGQAFAYLTKDISADELAAVIRHAVEAPAS